MSRRKWWDNAIVYHVVTDRFLQGGIRYPLYGRGFDSKNKGGFHGGDFLGITKKILDGWFCSLGVNCIWISSPFEQIHGWVPSEDGCYRHHPYHGYWPHDFTTVEPSFGSIEEFRQLVDSAHDRGIRIVLDVGMSHVGYLDYKKYGSSPVTEADSKDDSDYFSANNCLSAVQGNSDFAWNSDWVISDLPGYKKSSSTLFDGQLHGLPRLRLDNQEKVTPPEFLLNTPGIQLQNFAESTVSNYLINWLTQWVAEFGIDGFRCDSAKHVGLHYWNLLKVSSSNALKSWKFANPKKAIDQSCFWMVGEVYGHGIDESEYFDYGFDSLLNFDFQTDLLKILLHFSPFHFYSQELFEFRLDRIFLRYSEKLLSGHHDFMSYISSHDTWIFNRQYNYLAAAALLLLPGSIQILYGDESGRDDADDTCSDMNWENIDNVTLRTWRKLGKFRARHLSIARGTHVLRSQAPYAFSRENLDTGDRVLVIFGRGESSMISVGCLWRDGTILKNYLSSEDYKVQDGCVHVTGSGLILLETK